MPSLKLILTDLNTKAKPILFHLREIRQSPQIGFASSLSITTINSHEVFLFGPELLSGGTSPQLESGHTSKCNVHDF